MEQPENLCMTPVHEQWCEDGLREWGGAGWRGEEGGKLGQL